MQWPEEFKPTPKDFDGLYLLIFPDPNKPAKDWPFISYSDKRRRDFLLFFSVEAYQSGCCSSWQRIANQEQQPLLRISP